MSRRLLAPLAALGLSVAAPPAAAGERLELDQSRIDQALAAMVEEGRTAGASLLLWKDGREAYFAAEGLADREDARPFTRDTLVQI